MNDLDPNSFPFPPEWLAGYIDDELAPEERALVETFLEEHPQFRAQFDLQSSLSVGNEEFVRQIAPPTVPEAAWARVFAKIELALEASDSASATVHPSRSFPGWRSLATLAALSVTLAALILLVLPTNVIPLQQGVARYLGLDEPIEVATAEEVDILSLDESAFVGLVVGRHPLAISPLVLATFDEVDLHGVEPDVRGEFPELQMTPHGTTSPMIWARLDPNVSK